MTAPRRVLSLLVLLTAGCLPSSLKQAVLRNPDEFPRPYAAVVPPSSDTALGREPVAGRAPDDIVLSAKACFAVGGVVKKKGLDDIHVAYRNAVTLKGELRYVAVGAGVGLKQTRKADLRFRGLVAERGLPRPQPENCDFPPDQVRHIVTSQVRAGSAELGFASDTALQPKVDIPVGSTGAEVAVAVGWERSGTRDLRGRDIVLAAMPERYRVQFTKAEHNLGPTPQPGQVFDVGTSTLRVTVLEFDAKTATLVVRVDGPGVQALPEDAGQGVCSLGVEQRLPQRQTDPAKPGNNCLFWAYPSGTAAWVQWAPRARADAAVQDVVLRVDMYLTRPCEQGTCPPDAAEK